jgi:CHAT domain-containing protein
LGVSFAHGLAPRPSSDLRSALIVVDPTRTLEHAAKEAESVAQTLRAAGLSVQLLAGAEVTRARVIAGLGKADLVHFVGHGQRQGQRALEQTLRLFDGQTLSASDLLTLRNTPAWVILSACEAGRQDSGQLSLARAFLAQGSKQVLAATRTVDDGATRLLMEEVYAHLPEVKSLPQALQFAAAKVQQTLPESDWAAFRVFVR